MVVLSGHSDRSHNNSVAGFLVSISTGKGISWPVKDLQVVADAFHVLCSLPQPHRNLAQLHMPWLHDFGANGSHEVHQENVPASSGTMDPHESKGGGKRTRIFALKRHRQSRLIVQLQYREQWERLSLHRIESLLVHCSRIISYIQDILVLNFPSRSRTM